MIPAVTQTLADILVEGSSIIKKSHIDLSHPAKRQDIRPAISLYLYDLRESKMGNYQQSKCYSNSIKDKYNINHTKVNSKVFWYNLAFAIIAWDWTNIGQQHLLSEALHILLKNQSIDEQKLPSELKGYGDLFLEINTLDIDVVKFWKALKVAMQPALYLNVHIPFKVDFQDVNFTYAKNNHYQLKKINLS